MKVQKTEESKVITPRTPTTVDVESEPVVTTDIEINWEYKKETAEKETYTFVFTQWQFKFIQLCYWDTTNIFTNV